MGWERGGATAALRALTWRRAETRPSAAALRGSAAPAALRQPRCCEWVLIGGSVWRVREAGRVESKLVAEFKMVLEESQYAWWMVAAGRKLTKVRERHCPHLSISIDEALYHTRAARTPAQSDEFRRKKSSISKETHRQPHMLQMRR